MTVYKYDIDILIALARLSANSDSEYDGEAHTATRQIPEAVYKIFQHGEQARLTAIERLPEIRDMFMEIGVLSQIVRGNMLEGHNEFASKALWLLANSSNPEHWALMAEAPHIFFGNSLRTGVPRTEFKKAYVQVWKIANDATKANIEECLHRRGFKHILGVWI